ncbi:MAG TPA: hypothetical protein VGK25_08820, partial [Ignavibacteria bacterium]
MKYFLAVFIMALLAFNINSQALYEQHSKDLSVSKLFQDTTNKKAGFRKKIAAIFLGVGGGISIPGSGFKDNSDVTFGILGRLEFSSTGIFPFVIGGEVTYFSYNGSDLFKTTNVLANFKTKIFSYGLNIEYSLTKIFHSSFTMPFVTVDVKNNSITREYDDDTTFADLPRTASKISAGAGIGLTIFIFDFH